VGDAFIRCAHWDTCLRWYDHKIKNVIAAKAGAHLHNRLAPSQYLRLTLDLSPCYDADTAQRKAIVTPAQAGVHLCNGTTGWHLLPPRPMS